MNEQQTIKRLLDGLYHRPYTTTLTLPHEYQRPFAWLICQEVETLAAKYNVKVETIEINNEFSKARCTFEVKPW